MAIKRKDSENTRIVVDKLRQDVNNKLQYWLKKVPRYNELNFLIEEGNKKNEDVSLLLDELNTMKALFSINKPKSFLEKQQQIKIENMHLMHKSFEYVSLQSKKRLLKNRISRHTPHWYVKQIDAFRNMNETSTNLNRNNITELELHSTDINSIDESADIGDYKMLCSYIAGILSIPVNEIIEMKSTVIKSKLTKYFSENFDVDEMKQNLLEVEAKLTQYIVNFTKKPDITNIIFSAYGDISEPKTEKILKEIMFSINILNVYAISQKVCLSKQNTHMSSDAIGFGTEGLIKAINKWYETQLMVNQPLSFDGFIMKYVKYDVINGLRDLTNSGMIKSSNYNSVNNKNRQEIELFLESNPQYAHLEYNELFEMLQPHSKTLKRIDSVNNESTITEKVASNSGNENDGGVDVFSNSSVDVLDSLDIMESKHEYDKMMKALDDIFDTGKFVIYDYNHYDEPLYEESKEKMFSIYDKELFLMDIGFKYKHRTNQPYTLKEMAEVLIFMYKKNGVSTNRVGEEMTFGVSTISIRLKKIRENLKKAILHKPSLLEGFKYFVNVKDKETFQMKNVEKLVYMSNKRENINYKPK